MQSHETLDVLVSRYREASWKQWRFVTLAAAGGLVGITIIIGSFQLFRYVRMKKEEAHLQWEIEERNKEIGEHLAQAKQLKSLRHVHAILTSQFQIDTLLKAISANIPDRTLLTSLSYQRSEISLEGYAPDHNELEVFIASLRSTELMSDLRILHQALEAAGIKFTVQATFVT